MDPFSILLAWPCYLLIEALVRYVGFAKSVESYSKIAIPFCDFIQSIILFYCKKLVEFFQWPSKIWGTIIKFVLLYICSPGWVVTDFLKSKIKYSDGIIIQKARQEFICLNNTDNIFVSVCFFLLTMAFHRSGFRIPDIFVGILFWRFISRSIEIAYAFTTDIIDANNQSGIEKGQRIQLALKSYLEIFLYSAAFYSVLSPHLTFGDVLLGALYVGTLTDVKFVTECVEFKHFVFVQVFTTLSLIILSIAGYLSNSKNVAIPHTHRPPRQ